MEGLAQANTVLTRSNSAVMSQLAYMTVAMNVMKAQMKPLASDQTNQTRSKRNYYCWIFCSNYTHGSKNFSPNKSVHQE